MRGDATWLTMDIRWTTAIPCPLKVVGNTLEKMVTLISFDQITSTENWNPVFMA